MTLTGNVGTLVATCSMQKIEYRVWDTELKKWYEPIFEAYKGNLFELLLTPAGEICERTLEGFRHESCFKGKYIVNLWTGLYDSKNTKIFENDIVAYKNPDGSYVNHQVVQYIESSGGFEPYSDSVNNCGCCGGRIFPDEKEVVGNIYQNPEMLK